MTKYGVHIVEYYLALKNGDSNTFYNLDEPWRHYVELMR